MRERLAHAGYWRAEVELEETRAPGSRHLDLVFHVRPGPALSVDVKGVELPRGRRRALASILRDGAARPDALEAGAETHRRASPRGGLPRPVRCGTTSSLRRAGERIVYDVTPGAPATVAAVEVRGASELAGPRRDAPGHAPARRSSWPRTRAPCGTPFGSAATWTPGWRRSCATEAGQLPVLFRVEPGPATLVERITVEATLPPGEEVTTELLLRAGQPYRVRALAADRSRVTTAYRNAGYLDAEVEPKRPLQRRPDACRGQASRWRRDRAWRWARSWSPASSAPGRKSSFARSPSSTGRALSLEKLLEGQRRLSALGLFERVSLTPLEGERGPRDVLVSLQRGPRHHDRLRRGLLRARPLPGQRGGDAPQPLRPRPQPDRLRPGGLPGPALRPLLPRALLPGPAARLLRHRLLRRRGPHDLRLHAPGRDRADHAPLRREPGRSSCASPTRTPTSSTSRCPSRRSIASSAPTPSPAPPRPWCVDNRDNPLDARRRPLPERRSPLLPARPGRGPVREEPSSRLPATPASGASSPSPSPPGSASPPPSENRCPTSSPCPSASSRGATTPSAGSRSTPRGPSRRARTDELFPTGGNGLLLGSAELRRDLGRALTLAAFFDLGNVYPAGLRHLALRPALHRRPRAFATGPRSDRVRLDWGVKLNPRPGESGYRVHLTVGNAY